MDVQAVGAIVSVIAAAVASGLSVSGFIRSGRVEDAKLRSDAATIGLETVKFAQGELRTEVSRLTQLVGELRGQLDECLRQRDSQTRELHQQAREIGELRARFPK